MRSGEGFLLVYSVTDKARYVNCTKQYPTCNYEIRRGVSIVCFVTDRARYDKKIKTKKQKTKRRREVHGNIFFF